MAAALGEQPFAQAEQFSCCGAEGPHLFLHLSIFPNHQQASHHRGLVHIQSTTALHQGFHNASMAGDCCAAGLLQTLSCVLPVSRCDKKWYLYRRGSVSFAGSVSSQSKNDLQAIANHEAFTTKTDPRSKSLR